MASIFWVETDGDSSFETVTVLERRNWYGHPVDLVYRWDAGFDKCRWPTIPRAGDTIKWIRYAYWHSNDFRPYQVFLRQGTLIEEIPIPRPKATRWYKWRWDPDACDWSKIPRSCNLYDEWPYC